MTGSPLDDALVLCTRLSTAAASDLVIERRTTESNQLPARFWSTSSNGAPWPSTHSKALNLIYAKTQQPSYPDRTRRVPTDVCDSDLAMPQIY